MFPDRTHFGFACPFFACPTLGASEAACHEIKFVQSFPNNLKNCYWSKHKANMLWASFWNWTVTAEFPCCLGIVLAEAGFLSKNVFKSCMQKFFSLFVLFYFRVLIAIMKYSKAYSEPIQTSKMERFAKKLFTAKSRELFS